MSDLPNSAAMVGAMTSWCRVAERGQQYIYHLGSLARDRRASAILNIVAKPPAIPYPKPWMPTKGDMEPPF